jgi:chitinase
VIGYYPWYEVGEVAPAAFPYSKVTHVAIGNVFVTDAGCCTPPPGAESTWASYAPASVAAAHAAGTKVILQLGGADNAASGWVAGTATDAATAKLAQSIVTYSQTLGVDGVSIDWEQGVDEFAVGRLAKQIRNLWPAAVITADIGPFDEDLSWVASLAPYVDRLDAMTYISVGNWGGWEGPWHQGALYGDSAANPMSVSRKVTQLIAAGVPPGKIGFGLGLFGMAYGDANGDGNCPSAPTSGWNGEWGSWFGDYQLQLDDIERLYAPAMTRTFDPVTRTPYLSAPAPGAGGEADGWPPKVCYITYEDEQSATEKGQYAKAQGIGAIIVWAVPQDHRNNGTYPVLDALNVGLR